MGMTIEEGKSVGRKNHVRTVRLHCYSLRLTVQHEGVEKEAFLNCGI